MLIYFRIQNDSFIIEVIKQVGKIQFYMGTHAILTHVISFECSFIIEFIKQVGEKQQNLRLCRTFYLFFAKLINKFNNTARSL